MLLYTRILRSISQLHNKINRNALWYNMSLQYPSSQGHFPRLDRKNIDVHKKSEVKRRFSTPYTNELSLWIFHATDSSEFPRRRMYANETILHYFTPQFGFCKIYHVLEEVFRISDIIIYVLRIFIKYSWMVQKLIRISLEPITCSIKCLVLLL